MKAILLTICCVVLSDTPTFLRAEDAKPRAARSVHLWYRAPEAKLFLNAVTVEESQNGSYFAVCGFQHGYFGIQQLGSPNDKVVIFSVWDPGKQNDPKKTPEARRVKVLYHAKDVRVKRFGGEGTGAQSFYSYPWKIGEKCRFAIASEAKGDRTAYQAFFFLNKEKKWKHLATFETITGGAGIKGFYSFVEDFRRDGKSPNQRRSAIYSDGWVRTKDDHLISLSSVTFTADGTPLNNINAELAESGFRLATGGETKQKARLRSKLQRNPTGVAIPVPVSPQK